MKNGNAASATKRFIDQHFSPQINVVIAFARTLPTCSGCHLPPGLIDMNISCSTGLWV